MFTDEELKILKDCVKKVRGNYVDYFYKSTFKSIINKLDKEMWVKLP